MNTKHIEALKLAMEAIEACLSAGTEAEDQDAYEKLCDCRKGIREAQTEMQRLYEVEKEYHLFLATIKTQVEQLPQRSHT